MARVVLIFPRPNRIHFDTTWTINLGLAYSGAALEMRGNEMLVCDANVDAPARFDACLRGADLACIYTVTATLKAAIELAQRIKAKQPHATVMLGGPHVTARPRTRLTPLRGLRGVGEGEALARGSRRGLEGPGVSETAFLASVIATSGAPS